MSKFYVISSRYGCSLNEPAVFAKKEDAVDFVKRTVAELIIDECEESLADDGILSEDGFDELSPNEIDAILAWGKDHDYCSSYNTESVIDTFTYGDAWAEHRITEFDSSLIV